MTAAADHAQPAAPALAALTDLVAANVEGEPATIAQATRRALDVLAAVGRQSSMLGPAAGQQQPTTAAQLRDALAKREATAKARAALIGAILTPSHDDTGRPTWILSRWSLTRELASLDEVERLLDSMGAPA